MVYPEYLDHQQQAIPYPADYVDEDRRRKRSPAFAASMGGLVAVLVLAVGILLGVQLTRPDPAQPDSASSSAIVPTRVASSGAPSLAPEPAPREAQRKSAQEAARLDRSTYESVSPREFALMAKDPDGWVGRKIVIYGVVTQFDAATGATAFRAETGPAPMSDPYDYDQNTFVNAHDSAMVSNIVEKDTVAMFVEVQGAYTYDTQIGGSTTVPSLLVNIIEPASLPTPYPTADSVSGSSLRSTAASDEPFVAGVLTDRWVPQLSSKRLGILAEGHTWTNAMILADHQQLRQTYPGVRLVWSGDWSTFSDSDFWVTIVGTGFPTAEQALAWCSSAGLDGGHCYAKLISTTHPAAGSTAYNK